LHCCCADTTVNSSTDGTNAVSDASPDSGTNGVSDLISDDACPDSGPGGVPSIVSTHRRHMFQQ
jgi:hypothetical protein